jgi:hypothetical protein
MDFAFRNSTSDNLYANAWGVTTGTPVNKIEPNRGVLFMYDPQAASNFSSPFSVILYGANGLTYSHTMSMTKQLGGTSPRIHQLIECEVYGIGALPAGVTCYALS